MFDEASCLMRTRIASASSISYYDGDSVSGKYRRLENQWSRP